MGFVIISLLKVKPNMVKIQEGLGMDGYACLEGMGEFDEDETEMSGLESWLREDVSFFVICYI